jgi:Flp pilus assembly pilin Flp
MRKFLTDRRGITSLEYAVVAASMAIVLIEVLQVPLQALANALGSVFGGGGGGGQTP